MNQICIAFFFFSSWLALEQNTAQVSVALSIKKVLFTLGMQQLIGQWSAWLLLASIGCYWLLLADLFFFQYT